MDIGEIVGQMQQSLLWPVAGEILLLAQVVARVIGGDPVRQRIDFERQLLGVPGCFSNRSRLGTSDSNNSSSVSFN